MTNRPRPAIALVALLAAAFALAGCSRITGPRQWTETAELLSGRTYVVNVRDTSGRIDDVAIDPAGVTALEPVANPPGQPNVALVSWTGGACDQQTDIAISGAGAGIAITVTTRVAPGVCDAIGVGHVLRLTSRDALPAAVIQVRAQP